MTELAKEMKKLSREELEKIISEYDNGQILSETLLHINSRLEKLSQEGIWRKKELPV